MSRTVKTAEELLSLYNEIDHAMRRKYRANKYVDHGYLIQELAETNRVIAKHQQLMRTVSQIRNSLIHNPIPAVQPIITPNPALVTAYREVRDALLHPATALSVAVPASQMYTATLQTNLAEVMRAMDANIFTHVPIIEKQKMVGIFSENTLLSFLADNGEGIITNDMTVGDLNDFLPLDAHRGECFRFLPRNAPLSKVYELFKEAISERQRIGMVFITEHGKEHQKPIGIITAWDLASPEFDL